MIEATIWLKTEIAERTSLFCQSRVVRQHHPSFARANELVGVEAETAQSSEAAATPPNGIRRVPFRKVLGAVRFRRVFDDGQAVLLCQQFQWVHVNGMAINMHRHNCTRFLTDFVFHLLDVHAPSPWIGIDKNWHTAVVDHRESA